MKNVKAAGLDRILHEMWKELLHRFEKMLKEGKYKFNISKAFTIVFNDIRTYGMAKNTDFANK